MGKVIRTTFIKFLIRTLILFLKLRKSRKKVVSLQKFQAQYHSIKILNIAQKDKSTVKYYKNVYVLKVLNNPVANAFIVNCPNFGISNKKNVYYALQAVSIILFSINVNNVQRPDQYL